MGNSDGLDRRLQPAFANDAVQHRGRVLLALALLAICALAQSPPPPVSGAAGLELMLRRLDHTGVVMITNAHPDDEPNALIAMLAHGLGMRVVECTATRGEGGQNDLGPEQGLALSVLRTEELLAVHRIDGAEQLFARAVDFGYSFSVKQTFAKWGKDEILADYVRLIRMVRPDVIITMSPDGGGGGQHHQASALITREAFEKSGDPNEFPEQIAGGLRPWTAARLYVPLGGPPAADGAAASRAAETRKAESAPQSRPGDVTIDTDVFDAALGCTYHEIGTRARSMHKSQGMARLLALPGPAVSKYRLAAGIGGSSQSTSALPAKSAQALFPETRPGIVGLGRFCTNLDDDLQLLERLLIVESAILTARRALADSGPGAAVGALVDGLRALRGIRAMTRKDPRSFVEIDQRIAQKEAQFLQAIQVAAGLRFEALADAGVVSPGQEVKVSVYVANRLAPELLFERVTFEGFDPAEGGCATRPTGPLKPAGLVTCESRLRIPADARLTSAHWRRISGVARDYLESDVPFGVPFRPSPFRVEAHMSLGGEPLVFETPVEFRDGSDVVAGEKRGELLVVPVIGASTSYQRIEYPHTRRRHLCPAPTRMRPAVDAVVQNGLVGLVPGVGDRLDEKLFQFFSASPIDLPGGVRQIDAVGVFDVIIVGSRALELRPEVRSIGPNLRAFAENGGTLIVLYQRSGLDETTAAPYPAKTGANRITDENAPVKVLVPDHPVFNTPNRLTAEDWGGWVQERGRSFLETTDARYVDLIELEDPFEFNKGPKRGVLVEAKVGKGRWVYVGLALSRQLEEGVPGAYRLMANLLSLRGVASGESRSR